MLPGAEIVCAAAGGENCESPLEHAHPAVVEVGLFRPAEEVGQGFCGGAPVPQLEVRQPIPLLVRIPHARGMILAVGHSRRGQRGALVEVKRDRDSAMEPCAMDDQ